MDIFERRRDKLREVLTTMKAAELARKSGVSASYISRCLKEPLEPGYKMIGEVTARKLEKGLKKPEGWLDAQTLSPPLLQNQSQFFSPTVTVDQAPQLSPFALELAERFDRLTVKETRLEALNACLDLLEARAEQARPKALKQSNGAGV